MSTGQQHWLREAQEAREMKSEMKDHNENRNKLRQKLEKA